MSLFLVVIVWRLVFQSGKKEATFFTGCDASGGVGVDGEYNILPLPKILPFFP